MGMNIPSFLGYFTSHRSMITSQMALNTVNHNIANANTPGYSRQRVDLETMSPYMRPSLQDFEGAGQMGQGVIATGISRSHESFLDAQVRTQQSLLGYNQAVRDALQQAEGIFGEPSENDISKSMKNFFDAAQAVSVHPDDMAARSNFLQESQNLLEVFQQKAQQLQDLRTNLVGDASSPATIAVSQVAMAVDDMNAKMQQVADLNGQILTIKASGASPNDLLDRRDVLLEELSKSFNVSVEYRTDEQVNLKLGNTVLVRGSVVLDTFNVTVNPTIPPSAAPPDYDQEPSWVELASAPGASINSSITGGKLGGLLVVGSNVATETTIRGLLEGLDTLFTEVATNINSLQDGVAGSMIDPALPVGRDYYGNIPAAPNDSVFVLGVGAGLDIFNYGINANLVADPKLLAASLDNGGAFSGVGDGRNALEMAKFVNEAVAGLGNVTVNDYFNNMVSQMGVSTRSTTDRADNLKTLVDQLDQRRQAYQGVNMEEEMIDMLRYQRGFEATAKVLNTIDHVMDTIINKLI